MATPPLAVAAAELIRRDRVIAGLADLHGEPELATRTRGLTRFEALARSIIYQQLAGSAASAIYGRVRSGVGGAITPETLIDAGPEQLRSFGLSGAKTASLLDLAAKAHSGEVSLARIGRLSDDDVVAHLITVRGIGPWTAEMFLIFSLGRLDVWPVSDLGVRAGYAAAWGLDEHPSPAELAALGDAFRPYRSVAAWYCWRAADKRAPQLPAAPAATRRSKASPPRA